MTSYISASGICANPCYKQAGKVLSCGLKAFLSVSDQNAKLYLEHSHPEALHQYRVALRHGRSLIKANRKALELKYASELSLALKNLLDPTGSLRDTEVFLEQLGHYSFDLNEQLVLGRQQMMEDMEGEELVRRRNNVCSWFNSDSYYQKRERFLNLIEDIETLPGAGAQQDLIEKFIDKQKKWLDNRLSRLSELPTEELHRFRIKVKTLRYTTSFYKQWQNTVSLKTVKKVQDHLGLIHDYSVQNAFICHYIAQKQPQDKNLKFVALFAGYLQRYLSEKHDYHLELVRHHMKDL